MSKKRGTGSVVVVRSLLSSILVFAPLSERLTGITLWWSSQSTTTLYGGGAGVTSPVRDSLMSSKVDATLRSFRSLWWSQRLPLDFPPL